MSFIDKLGDSIVSMSKDVGQKAKEASGIAKLKLDIRIKQEYVKEQYAQLGKVYYEAHKKMRMCRKSIALTRFLMP